MLLELLNIDSKIIYDNCGYLYKRCRAVELIVSDDMFKIEITYLYFELYGYHFCFHESGEIIKYPADKMCVCV